MVPQVMDGGGKQPVAVGLGLPQLGFQRVAEGHQVVDFGEGPILSLSTRQGDRTVPQLCHIDGRQVRGLLGSVLEIAASDRRVQRP
jgi:acyl CoA:acetate/3-ketoacid CoA transferase beta subunit